MKFQLEFHPNPDCMTIHVRKRLTNKMIECWDDVESMDKEDKYHRPAPAYVKEIAQIDGVNGDISLHPYELSVIKGHLFSWEDLSPQIVEAMKKHFEAEGTVEMVDSPIMPSEEAMSAGYDNGDVEIGESVDQD
jgi:hypothetical protein